MFTDIYIERLDIRCNRKPQSFFLVHSKLTEFQTIPSIDLKG